MKSNLNSNNNSSQISARKINKLLDIMALLRNKDKGCPWDKEQNFASIAPCTIEEAYEVLDAIEKNDMSALKEELGDLLLQVVFHAQMAAEQNIFNFQDVVNSITTKLITRHPHIFEQESSNANIKTAKDQEIAWEQQKEQERNNKVADSTQYSVLDGVANALPSLLRAAKLQKRAAKIGFDWPDLNDVFAKIVEELQEVKQEIATNGAIEEEIGDLLFSVVNLARKLNIDPEQALRGGNAKFTKRFNYIEKQFAAKGLNIKDAELSQMDKLWNEAKKID
jgi:ATP diphosphatase